jgi:hypothetical protein
VVDHALYVGVKPGGLLSLPHVGYPRAFERFGWSVAHLGPDEASREDLSVFDLILWNGPIPASVLGRIRAAQTLVAMNGGGDDLSHYDRYRRRIALATSSLYFFDEPRSHISLRHVDPRRATSRQFFLELRYTTRFHRFASPRFFRDLGIPFVYLPFASDPKLFFPKDGVERDLRWAFVGHLQNRRVVPALERESRGRGWAVEIHAPERGNTIDPLTLNDLYNRCTFGVNEQHALHSGRELNERSYDLGMAGVPQISDMGWMGLHELGPWQRYYAAKVGRRMDLPFAAKLLDSTPVADPHEIHGFFKRHHSFEARIATISAALGADLSNGQIQLSGRSAVFDGVEFTPQMLYPA